MAATNPLDRRSRFLVMFALVLAGELIFSLPFHLTRYFRPTVLEVFRLTNANLGDVFAVYGLTAMLSYFPGGAIADRVSARKLMSLSLAATAGGGLYLATLPGPAGMTALFAWWGVTTILLFWAAMIRATRAWGGALAQGRAFGVLDGGRGLAAAAFASIAVWLFSTGLGTGALLDAGATRAAALKTVIYYYTGATLGAGALIWLLVPDSSPASLTRSWRDLSGVRSVLRLRAAWLQAAVVLCAYCGYKGLDNYALYAYDVLGMSETDAARFSASSAYIRPVAALAAGFLADRAGVARVLAGLFAALTLCYALLGNLDLAPGTAALIIANLMLTFFGVFALRGVYFALLEETRTPRSATGAAVGLISVVGYTPDVFFAPVAGRLLDATPGAGGHQHYFILLAGIAIIGLTAAVALTRAAASPAPAR